MCSVIIEVPRALSSTGYAQGLGADISEAFLAPVISSSGPLCAVSQTLECLATGLIYITKASL